MNIAHYLVYHPVDKPLGTPIDCGGNTASTSYDKFTQIPAVTTLAARLNIIFLIIDVNFLKDLLGRIIMEAIDALCSVGIDQCGMRKVNEQISSCRGNVFIVIGIIA